MKSLSTRLAIVISSVLLCLVLVVGVWLEKKLRDTIAQQGIEQAEVHAQTILGSLKTLMLNGSGTLAKDWLGRLQGVAGIKDIEVLRRDGQPAFTDLTTVQAVNEFLGKPVFQREEAPLLGKFAPLQNSVFERALSGEVAHDVSRPEQITIAMPIQADLECYTCHGYDTSLMRGVLKLSLSNEETLLRIQTMQNSLFTGATVLVLLLGLALWTSLRFNVIRPIEVLRDAIRRVGEGERKALVPIERKDELGELARVFNQMQEALSASETRIRAVMDNVVDAIVTIQEDGTIDSVNPAVLHLFGYEERELIGKNISILTPEKPHSIDETVLGPLEEGNVRPLLGLAREISGRRQNGTVFPMDVAVSEMYVGENRYFIAIMRDITSRKARTAALRYQALHDALTDLPNRTLLTDRLQQSLRSAERDKENVSLLLLDLDRFKEVNDTLGHHVGDKLLQQIAQRLKLILRESDTVARLGGDEFCVLLNKADASQAMFTARKIINTVERAVSVEGQTLTVGASIGIAVYPLHGDNPVVLMQRADVAMYVAKRGNKGFSIYDHKRDPHSLRQLAISSELRNAIEQEQLIVHYQPKVDIKENRFTGVEALVRWQHPQHGLLLPEEFIPLAEQSGLIRPLTMWVLRRAFRECKQYLDTGNQMRLSVNLSMRDLADNNFAEQVAVILDEEGLSSSRVKFEITETAIMESPQKIIRALDRLNAMGLRISIDDFGIGYSSLSYLKQLPVNELKIDKSFGLSLASDGNSAVIVRSTIDLAHKLGLRVVAEGVENRETYDLLGELGCDAAQGYYVGRPMSMPHMIDWVAQNGSFLQALAEESA